MIGSAFCGERVVGRQPRWRPTSPGSSRLRVGVTVADVERRSRRRRPAARRSGSAGRPPETVRRAAAPDVPTAAATSSGGQTTTLPGSGATEVSAGQRDDGDDLRRRAGADLQDVALRQPDRSSTGEHPAAGGAAEVVVFAAGTTSSPAAGAARQSGRHCQGVGRGVDAEPRSPSRSSVAGSTVILLADARPAACPAAARQLGRPRWPAGDRACGGELTRPRRRSPGSMALAAGSMSSSAKHADPADLHGRGRPDAHQVRAGHEVAIDGRRRRRGRCPRWRGRR